MLRLPYVKGTFDERGGKKRDGGKGIKRKSEKWLREENGERGRQGGGS